MYMKRRHGYACINMQLAEKGIRVSRKMTQAYFLRNNRKLMLAELSKRTLENIKDLNKILSWNYENGIDFYRMSSSMVSLTHLVKLEELPDYDEIVKFLKLAGDFSTEKDIRLSFHPGAFNVLASPNETTVNKTIEELNVHSEIMDIMGLSKTHYNPINIHIGGAYGDRKSAMETFARNWDRLSDSTKARLNVENDDRPNLFSVKDLTYLNSLIGIPICFDYLHHTFCTGGLTEEEALNLAASTWGDIVPVTHICSSVHNEDSKAKHARSHAKYLYGKFETYGVHVDFMAEAKMKEVALLKWKKENLV